MGDETTPGIEAPTTIHDTVAQPESPLAYSETVELPELRRSHVPVVAFATAFLALGGACAGWFLLRPTPIANPAAPTPRPAAPVRGPIDGTYRVDHYRGQAVVRTPQGGVSGVNPDFSTVDTEWWAFRSQCATQPCTAVGTRLDDDTHLHAAIASTPGLPAGEATQTLRLVEGQWQTDRPNRVRQDCIGGVVGGDTWRWSLEVTQLPDSSLKGQESDVVESNECGSAGNTVTTPVVATRVGDIPPDLPAEHKVGVRS